MIQFIQNGPEIPEKIEQDLRNNNLVFFCGSGISAPAGLLVFDKLVKRICRNLRVTINKHPILKAAKQKKDYSSIVDLLERDSNEDYSFPPPIVRKKLIEILTKPNNKKVEIHKDLLALSAMPDQTGYRLVTTNFDRLFIKAGLKDEHLDSAPELCPPTKDKWKNLTFLHGVIDKDKDPEGKNLVLTSSDFGFAYLQDGRAAKFVIQLFQEFTVLFIGYSAGDPIMRYLISALSSKNQRKQKNQQSKPSIYAFADYKTGQKQEKENEWKAIGVEPISYQIQGENDHSLLYKTIKLWAEMKKTGLTGQKNWLKTQLSTPYKGTADNEKAKTVISFLKTDKKLAEQLPAINLSSDADPKKHQVVDISWHKAFFKAGLMNKLIKRTAPASCGLLWEPLSLLEKNIGQWLCEHHLNTKELIHWLIDSASSHSGLIYLHPEFKAMIKRKLNDNQTIKLNKRIAAFWEIIISQKALSDNLSSFYGQHLIYALNKHRSYAKTKELLYVLEPQIGFTKDFYDTNFLDSDKIYDPKLIINIGYPLSDPLQNEALLIHHAEDWTNLLKKAMELAKQTELITNGEDAFYFQKPSIERYTKKTNAYSWTYLIDLARDSFNLSMKQNKPLADLLLKKWERYPYSIFYRLILYAVTKHNCLNESTVLNLFKNNKIILWSTTCQNEVLRYLSGRQHSEEAARGLSSLIMKGPPESLYNINNNDDRFTELKEIDIIKRLHCLKDSKTRFPEETALYYKKIQLKYNTPKQRNDLDNFPYRSIEAHWSGSSKRYHTWSDKKIFNDIKNTIPFRWPPVDEKKAEFRSFIKESPKGPDRAFKILLMFKDNALESAPYCGGFIFAASELTEAKKNKKWFLKAFEKIEKFNDDFFKECLWSLIHSLDLNGGFMYLQNKERFKKWWMRVWELSIQQINKPLNKNSDMAMDALNGHLGKLSQLILNILWHEFPTGKISKNGKIPKNIQEYFTIILPAIKKKEPSALFHFGSYLPQLWHLDKTWTINSLKPLMSGGRQTAINACCTKALWQGYLLYNMYFNLDFLNDFKKEFFNLFLNYKIILNGRYKKNYIFNIAELFLRATGGKEIENIFSTQEIKELKKTIDMDMLDALSHQIWQLLENTDLNKTADLWSKKIKPWINSFWPQQTNKKNYKIAQKLSLVVLHCGNKLPDAFEDLQYKIKGVIKENNSFIIHHIENNKDKLNSILDYPNELLKLLNWNFPKDTINYKEVSILNILHQLKNKDPEIEQQAEYKKLLGKLS